MVRLRNPMADLVGAGPGAPRPGVDDDASLLARLDGPLRRHLREALAHARGRVLVVGAASSELVVELAERDCFVTVVDPDTKRLERLQRLVLDLGLARGVTLDPRSYADIRFSGASFEAIVLYAPFAFLAAPLALVRKCRRELRAGGQLLIRVVLSAGAPYPDAAAQQGLVAERLVVPETSAAWARLQSLRDRAIGGLYRVLGRTRLLRDEARRRLAAGEIGDPARRGPAWLELREALDEELVVTRVDACQLLSFELAELASALRRPLATLPGQLVELGLLFDEHLLARTDARAMATTVLVHATKERELGRVFTLPRR